MGVLGWLKVVLLGWLLAAVVSGLAYAVSGAYQSGVFITVWPLAAVLFYQRQRIGLEGCVAGAVGAWGWLRVVVGGVVIGEVLSLAPALLGVPWVGISSLPLWLIAGFIIYQRERYKPDSATEVRPEPAPSPATRIRLPEDQLREAKERAAADAVDSNLDSRAEANEG